MRSNKTEEIEEDNDMNVSPSNQKNTNLIRLKKHKLTQEEENESDCQKEPHVSALARLRTGDQKWSHAAAQFVYLMAASFKIENLPTQRCFQTGRTVCWSARWRFLAALLTFFVLNSLILFRTLCKTCSLALVLKPETLEFSAPPVWEEGQRHKALNGTAVSICT